jgi:hypothetical protein
VTNQEAVMAAGAFAGAMFLLWPISRAIAARIHGRREPPVVAGEQVDHLAVQVERLQQELLETQERLDFAERLLAQRREAEPLGPGARG